VGLPVAAAVKLTSLSAQIVRLEGLAVMTGGVFTVRVAAPLVEVAHRVVKRALNMRPFWLAWALNV
jgi:hypothetical protein